MRHLTQVVLLVGLPLLVSCSTSRSGGGVYRAELARGPSERVLVREISGVLQSYGYEIRSTSRNEIETEWRARAPYAAELQEGIREVRDRAIVSITPRATNFLNARLLVHHEVLVYEDDDETWIRQDPPPPTQEQYEDIAQEARYRLQQYMTQN